ncbi:hypothetical protein [Streptomyces sp. PTD5-9]|uniref:hypothetical protein n=1 Tax=Streptomyces sp. PTD5-9 TaxID=3120150 RepID=UPI00300AE8E1
MVEDAKQRFFGIVARQLADGYEAPGWATAKLADILTLRRTAQASTRNRTGRPCVRPYDFTGSASGVDGNADGNDCT